MKFPPLDEELIKTLEKLYKPFSYTDTLDNETFIKKSAFAAGQIDVVNKLRSIYESQKKERLHV